MEERKNPFRNIKVVRRSSPPLLKIAVCVLIVFSMGALIALSWVQTGIRERTEDLRQEAAALENQNADYERKIGELGSIQSVQDIAQEELGLADPNTVIIDPNS